jgi:hypothetical protein
MCIRRPERTSAASNEAGRSVRELHDDEIMVPVLEMSRIRLPVRDEH